MINIKGIGRKEAVLEWNRLEESQWTLPSLTAEYAQIRKDINDINNEIIARGIKIKSYEYDARFAISLYWYFISIGISSLRIAANDNFWRYLSLVVVPDIVKKRWAKSEAEEGKMVDHFFARSNRIWLKNMWWYVHLSFQGDKEKTEEVLLTKDFSTDTILNLVERTGREGTNVELYRVIMEKYAHEAIHSNNSFRKMMVMNTVKSHVVEPMLCRGGIEGYVDQIIDELKIRKESEHE